MLDKIVIDGHFRWILPLLIVIVTAAFTLYTVNPAIEYFTENKTEKDEAEKDETEKEETEKDETEKDGKEKDEKEKDEKEKDETEKNKNIKENFVTFTNTTEVLRKNWRKENLQRTLEQYNGPIRGYNCGEYSNFSLGDIKSISDSCNSSWVTPPTGQDDYIFPERKQNKTNCVKYASEPNIIRYENDVNEKILEYESMNVFPKYKPPNSIVTFDRPQYMHHRNDSKNSKTYPIISDENSFELGHLNTFKRHTPEYSVE